MKTKEQQVCEWMGLIWEDRLHVKYGPDAEYSGYYCDGTPFDPWNNHEQFAEVWNKLNGKQKGDVIIKLGIIWRIKIATEVLNNLPAVMDAVLEVLGITEEGK